MATTTYLSLTERTYTRIDGLTVYEFYDTESQTWVATVIGRPEVD